MVRFRRIPAWLALLAVAASSWLVLAGCDNLPYQEPAAGLAVRYDFVSTADGLNLPASIYLPAGYDPAKSYPLWLEMHALEGIPIISNNPTDIFAAGIKSVADRNGWIVLSPWGRNLGGYYMDGVKKDSGANAEPNIIDDMSSLANWRTVTGSWNTSLGLARQSDAAASWKELVRTGSTGQDYAVRVRMRELSRSGASSAFGLDLRRDAVTGDCYRIDLYTEVAGSTVAKYVRLMRCSGGVWTTLSQVPCDWQPLAPGNTWLNLKVTSYAGNIKVFVNDRSVIVQPRPVDVSVLGEGMDCPGAPVRGEVALASWGGVHEFDELRVQNEYEYGERDVMDCINQAMEKFNIDETRVYASGLSMGGGGTWFLGLHHPGLFAAISPNAGPTDLVYDYQFTKDHYPANPGAPHAAVNDARLAATWRLIGGTEQSADLSLNVPLFRDYSARYLLENLANTPVRIIQGGADSSFPNSTQQLAVYWFAWNGSFWGQTPAPAPYSPVISTFANGTDIYNLLSAWAAGGPYSADYVTNPWAGHGFMESYDATAAYFATRTSVRHPEQVACKSYDDAASAAYWLSMKRSAVAGGEADLARASVNRTANSVDAHVRNAAELTLDLQDAGLDIGAGKAVTVHLDAATDPSAMPVADLTGRTDLVLLHAWPPGAGMQVRLDGQLLAAGTGYTIAGQSLKMAGISTGAPRTVTITMPASPPANLLANPSFELLDPDGSITDWTPQIASGGPARLELSEMQSHSGSRSVRIKDSLPAASPYTCSWRSAAVTGITAGKQYTFECSYRARVLSGASLRAAVYWYDSAGRALGTGASQSVTPAGSLTSAWTPLSFAATAPAGAVAAVVGLETIRNPAAPSGGSIWLDDAALYRSP